MRTTSPGLWVSTLALVAVACAPCHHRPGPHGPGMAMVCGRDACGYRSECFSDGAIRSNDGVCQACNAGKWVAATGCRECACHECGGKMGASCPHDGGHRHPGPAR